MLKHLYIKNYTLIDQLDIVFHSGFSVITGEQERERVLSWVQLVCC